MKELGCGTMMLRAIAATYRTTTMLLRSAVITSSIGVRQGSPTSCLLFTILVNKLITDLKEKCQPDGFLQWFHCLMLMDDTVLLATTRESALNKVKILREFCSSSGMVINKIKTKFMVINGKGVDLHPLTDEDFSVDNTDKYTYLGSIITQDGKISSSVQAHCQAKMAHVGKFEAYVRKNSDMPFTVKLKVFRAALMTAVLYGAETWVSNGIWRVIGPLYATCIKTLLGVRRTTATDLCLIEAGQPSISQLIKSSQKNMIYKLTSRRVDIEDDPLMFALETARRAKTPCAKYIDSLADFSYNDETLHLHTAVRRSTRTKFKSYCEQMNPSLTVHPIYTDSNIPEFKRIVTTKIRLSSHNLQIEKGRWSCKPREERLCTCGAIQDEQHILAHCPLNLSIRLLHSNVNCKLPDFYTENDSASISNLCYDLFEQFV